jgi:Transposase DDE domain
LPGGHIMTGSRVPPKGRNPLVQEGLGGFSIFARHLVLFWTAGGHDGNLILRRLPCRLKLKDLVRPNGRLAANLDSRDCTPAGVEQLNRQGAYRLVSFDGDSLPLESRRGQSCDLLRRFGSLTEAGRVGEWPVWVPGPTRRIEGRLCALRKSEQCILQAHRRRRRRGSKTGKRLHPATLAYAKDVVVFTTFPRQGFTAPEILQCYRVHWQIELVFKRLKSLAQLGHLPKYDESSSRAWLYGKMLVALLTQKLVRIGRVISPLGIPAGRRGIGAKCESLALLFTSCNRRLSPDSRWRKRSIIGMKSQLR